MTDDKRICLVGAGSIAETHAAAIGALSGLKVSLVVDPNQRARERLAARYGVEATCGSIEQAVAIGGFEAAHVLTPPDRHAETALPLLAAGVRTLVEKPLAASSEESRRLVAAAKTTGARLGVNQNFVFDPAFARLRARLAASEIGPLQHVACVYRAPLRQLAAHQFNHWMFRAPANMLLEQAVHPLSQVRALAGRLRGASVGAWRIEPAGGTSFIRSLTAAIDAEKAPVTFHFAVGESFPAWRIEAHGTDGVLIADMYQSLCYALARTRWHEAMDRALSSIQTAGATAGQSLGNAGAFGASLLRLAPRADPFFRSMRSSIAAFHKDGDLELDGAFGAELVELCERLSAAAPASPRAAPTVSARPREGGDVAVIGGTGFIGAATVKALVENGFKPRVMARHINNLDPVFASDSVTVVRGDAASADDVRDAIGAARYVINLAHGGGGQTYEEIRAGMLGAAEAVADLCRELQVERLVHVSSIAALYLGADAGGVGDDAPSDPKADRRSAYARAKAESDARMMDRGRHGLPVVVLRPGLVVGAGTSPFHSGVGMFNNEQHCIGWNDGRNPLPFVLVHDVADAIVRSLTAENAAGRSYLIVGDARPSARDYIEALALSTGRPLRFHPSSATGLWLGECAKWIVKRVGGNTAPAPSLHDIKSRGLGAKLDTSAAKRDLGWTAEGDVARFLAEAFAGVEPGA